LRLVAPRKLLFSIVLLGLVLACLVLSYQAILLRSGRFLAPEVSGKADALILEGTEVVRERVVKVGMGMLTSGQARLMVLVVHRDLACGRIFALPDYALLMARDLEALGLRQDQFQVIEVPSNHPITLTEARIVLAKLSRGGMRSVTLMADGFHARRSFWVYKQAGTALGMGIFVYPFFSKYEMNTWWRTVDGCYDFFTELIKLLYYVIEGYIPVRSLFAT
jgi:hypothetical protein